MQPPFKIYSTQEWGAVPVSQTFYTTTPEVQVVHHMDTPNRATIPDVHTALATAFQLARDCQNEHMNVNGWSDTGQHFTVTRDGIVLEGRHGSLAAAIAGHCIRGAHAADPDTGADANDSWGTEHEGTYTSAEMPPQQWKAAVHLQAWLAFQCKLDSTKIEGHRDTGCSTACPGDWFESQLSKFREEVHAAKLVLEVKEK